MRIVTIVPTGTANLASVITALRRAGAQPMLAAGPLDVLHSQALILPGVGNFGAAMAKLEADGTAETLREKLLDGTPALAICLGMQILFEASEENQDVHGLSILPGRFGRFPNTVRSPHVGWNTVEPIGAAKFLRPGDAYFTHSYRLTELPPNSIGAMTGYGAPFVSAIECGNILACQFHPELSGAWGIELLRRWIDAEGMPC